MRVGDLFAGIGGGSLSLSAVFPDAETVWQSDLVGEAVRARHFPDAAQLVGDVRALDPARLPAVDLLTAGFPCQDLSVAGGQAGLDGARSGLYSEVLRFTKAIRPERVLIENVPALLHYLPRLSADFRALGYGLTWTVCEAADAGLPHLRRRVFVLAERDLRGRGAVEVDQAGRWTAESEREWASPRASDADRSSDPDRAGGGTGGIVGQVRTWATATATDYKTPAGFIRQGHPPARIGEQLFAEQGKRLSPAWVEALMGYPLGWTAPEGGSLSASDIPLPVRGRYPEGWDRSTPWLGFDWEPPRTLPDGPPTKGRAARIRGLGNAWSPPQAALASRALWGSGAQLALL